MFKSYSQFALAEAKASISMLDKKLNLDLLNHPAPGIPEDIEWQFKSISELFGLRSKKRKAAQKRRDFNAGIITEVCLHHFDGKQKHFEIFCKEVIKAVLGRMIAKFFSKSFLAQTDEFRTGRAWGKEFIKRHIVNEVQYSKNEQIANNSFSLTSDSSMPSCCLEEPAATENFATSEYNAAIQDAVDFYFEIRALIRNTEGRRYSYYTNLLEEYRQFDDVLQERASIYRSMRYCDDITTATAEFERLQHISVDHHLWLFKKIKEMSENLYASGFPIRAFAAYKNKHDVRIASELEECSDFISQFPKHAPFVINLYFERGEVYSKPLVRMWGHSHLNPVRLEVSYWDFEFPFKFFVEGQAMRMDMRYENKFLLHIMKEIAPTSYETASKHFQYLHEEKLRGFINDTDIMNTEVSRNKMLEIVSNIEAVFSNFDFDNIPFDALPAVEDIASELIPVVVNLERRITLDLGNAKYRDLLRADPRYYQ